jgi:thymidylate synthase (FAD)
MKIITQPSVQIVSAPEFLPHLIYRLPYHPRSTEKIIAMAGKVCYDSYGEDGNPVDAHVRNLVNSGHHSVLEHVHVGLFLEGISRGCSHEIVRHRMFNYSQRSTRYTAEDDAAIVLDPFYVDIHGRADVDRTEAEHVLLEGFLNQCVYALEAYHHQTGLLAELAPRDLAPRDRRKWCRGKARQLLPHALETRMVMTGNLRSWRHFLVMRTSRHAEAEIRRLAQAVWLVLEPLAPAVFEDLRRDVVADYIELVAA